MQENDLLTWLVRTTKWKRTLTIGGGYVLAALFVGIPAAVLAYVYVGFSQQFTSLLISALGALSTVLLVAVTFATFVENQMRAEKENQRALVRGELHEVVQPSLSRLETNRSQMQHNVVSWHRFDADQWHDKTALGFELEPLYNRPDVDRVASSRFFEREPVTDIDFIKHDSLVKQLGVEGAELVETLTGPLAEYIEQNEIKLGSVESPDPELIANYVLNDVDELDDMNTYQELWVEYKDEFHAVADEIAGEEVESFRQQKREYLSFAESMKQKVEGIRGWLEQTYGLSLATQPASTNHGASNDSTSGYSAVESEW